MKSILIATSDATTVETFCERLSREYRIDSASSKQECFDKFERHRYEFTFIDIQLLAEIPSDNNSNGYQTTLHYFWHVFPTAQIIVLCLQSQIREAVNIVKTGASNYLTLPVNPHELKHVMESTDESTLFHSELDYLRDQFWQDDSLEIVRTRSKNMKLVFEKVRSVASTKATVLLLGETGVGKGVIAKLIHRHSDQSDQPFIHVHCGAIPDSLLESELFGHEKGAFTGANRRKMGRFEIAKRGTIFLDEVGTMTHSAQIKLLQVLQDKVFQRVGGETMIEADTRVIAATNHDLRKMSEKGEFRSDLYYRLSVFPINILSLKDRIEDLELLSEALLHHFNTLHQKEIHSIHPSVLEAMQRYSWPGNVRELENIMERAYILETSSILTPENFPEELFNTDVPKNKVLLDTSLSLSEIRKTNLEHIERQYLKKLLTLHQGKVNRTAETAGISTRQLHKLLTKYKIRKEEFRNIALRKK
ncbi:MAG: sigma-54-dependent Fis family transcriptional regulator [SAR324 cluster bacterium]|nr:sigma-54-dependent Fis family transcriptional regulator [SAR324 cluster bacterium]